VYPAADGFVSIAAQPQPFFETLCKALGADDILSDPRYVDAATRNRHRPELIEALSRRTAAFTKAQLTTRLGGQIPFGPVMNIADIAGDPHFAAREMLVPVEQPGADPVQIAGVPVKMTVTPGGVHRRAPLLGEDTLTRLREAGLSDAEIRDLLDKRAAVAADK